MRLPQMATLRALDGLARHGSMLKAAQELNVTPSAISHALRLLEKDLGFELTMRDGRGVSLTRLGRLYAAEVRRAIAILHDAHNVAREPGLRGEYSVSCTPGLAVSWLIPNLGEFRELFPEVALRISSPEDFTAVADPEVDLFIAYGNGTWRGYESELLTDLEFTPYCSPALLNARGGLTGPEDLVRYPLIHLRTYDDWTRWLSAAGVPNRVAETGIVVSNMHLMLTGMMAGVGVGIGDNIACRRPLTDGQLVRPFPLSVRSNYGYYFVCETEKRDHPIGRAFREWVQNHLSS